jgi:3-(3-hydroxy-phenyl)propionate hydroxylase
MLGEDVNFELEWVSIYTFQCRRMEKFRHQRVFFAGDSAHQVSPFGARGANSGLQDTDNLCWKLKMVIEGSAPESLLDTYDSERVHGAEENILNSSRSTDFITPKSDISRIFRDAVLALAAKSEFALGLVNSGRLSVPCTYDGSRLNGHDDNKLPARSRPGSSAIDSPVEGGWLCDQLGNQFQLLAINAEAPERLEFNGVAIETLSFPASPELRERYLGEADCAIYLMRPDQHVAARWTEFDNDAVGDALRAAISHN